MTDRDDIRNWSDNKLSEWYAQAVTDNNEINLIVLETELARRRITVDKPVCHLIGQDGNVFSIIGRVSRTLKRAGLDTQAKEFCRRAMKSSKYEDVLTLCDEYVEIK